MRRTRKPPSKAKQIRQLKEQLEHELTQMGRIARTAEEWKFKAVQLNKINQELHEENESIKQDFKTCKAWSSLECCIQHDSSLRVFRASIDIPERYLTSAHRIISPHILGNPLRTDRAKHDARCEIYEAALQISNIVRRKIADSMLDYFSDTNRQLNDGRIY
jgi:hypothetical protein